MWSRSSEISNLITTGHVFATKFFFAAKLHETLEDDDSLNCFFRHIQEVLKLYKEIPFARQQKYLTLISSWTEECRNQSSWTGHCYQRRKVFGSDILLLKFQRRFRRGKLQNMKMKNSRELELNCLSMKSSGDIITFECSFKCQVSWV